MCPPHALPSLSVAQTSRSPAHLRGFCLELACLVSLSWRDANSTFLGKPDPDTRHIFSADYLRRFLLGEANPLAPKRGSECNRLFSNHSRNRPIRARCKGV